MSTKRCYYETLEVDRTADESKLKAAFRKLAMKWHPDSNPGDAASEIRFKEINEAYEVLKDGDKRAAYDRFGHAAFEQGAGGGGPGFGAGFASSFSDIFEDLFGMAGQRGRGGGRERGADLRYNMEITPRRGVSGQDRPDRDSGLGHLRILFGHRRKGRYPAEDLLDVRRRRPRATGAGLLHAGANLSRLPGPRPDDRGSLSLLFGLGTGDARADLVGQYSARRGRRHPDPARRRRRGRGSRRPAGRSLHFPVAGHPSVLSARWRRSALPRADLDGDGGARRRIRGADHRQGPGQGENFQSEPSPAAAFALHQRACRCCARARPATCMSRSRSKRRKI